MQMSDSKNFTGESVLTKPPTWRKTVRPRPFCWLLVHSQGNPQCRFMASLNHTNCSSQKELYKQVCNEQDSNMVAILSAWPNACYLPITEQYYLCNRDSLQSRLSQLYSCSVLPKRLGSTKTEANFYRNK